MRRPDERVQDTEPGNSEPGGPGAPRDPADAGSGRGGLPPRAVAARRRRLFLGSGVAALAGMAVVVGGLGLPGLPPVFAFASGMATTATAFAAVYAGLFAG